MKTGEGENPWDNQTMYKFTEFVWLIDTCN